MGLVCEGGPGPSLLGTRLPPSGHLGPAGPTCLASSRPALGKGESQRVGQGRLRLAWVRVLPGLLRSGGPFVSLCLCLVLEPSGCMWVCVPSPGQAMAPSLTWAPHPNPHHPGPGGTMSTCLARRPSSC